MGQQTPEKGKNLLILERDFFHLTGCDWAIAIHSDSCSDKLKTHCNAVYVSNAFIYWIVVGVLFFARVVCREIGCAWIEWRILSTRRC